MTVVGSSHEQSLRAALMWAGPRAAGAGRSAGAVYRLEGVGAEVPEIVVPRKVGRRHENVVIHRVVDRASLRTRSYRGFRVTGVEPTLLTLGSILDAEAIEVACEDARLRKLTSMRGLQVYVERYGGAGRPGSAAMRALLDQLDPVHPSRSTLEVKTRRLLVANGITGFTREFPLAWNGKIYRYDFCFELSRTILETNGKAWHDDPLDYEDDAEKWSVPARHNYRLVFATWKKVTEQPHALLAELHATLTAA
jgi:hypothetical protein